MSVITSKQLSERLSENTKHGTEWIVVRIDGRDYVVDNVSKSHDGVIGDHIILNAHSISDEL